MARKHPTDTAPDAPHRAPPQAERARLLRQLGGVEENLVLRVEGHDIVVTHLDRVYWPAEPSLDQAAITKRDFLRYLIGVAGCMLPPMADRPLTLFRWPNGITARRVLQKHWDVPLPVFVERTTIFSDAKGRTDEYALCNNLATLLWLAHMGTLEFHVWHSRVRCGPDSDVTSTDFAASTAAVQTSIIEYPDYLLFDLDPFIFSGAEEDAREPELNVRAFGKVKTVAFSVKALLDRMRLASFVKTSGKSGLHVLVPIRRTVPYATVRRLARVLGEHLMHEHPDEITLQWSVERRTGKVFMDYNMNVRGKSMTAAYSPRGLPGAPVSMPLSWKRLERAYPTHFRIPTVPAVLKRTGDAWAGWLDDKAPIEQRLQATGR